MIKFLKRHGKDVALAAVLITSLFFIVNIITLGVQFSSGVDDSATERAEFYSREQEMFLSAKMNGYRVRVSEIAGSLSGVSTKESTEEQLMGERLSLYVTDTFFKDICYIKDGTVWSSSGEPVTSYEELTALAGAEGDAISRLFQYENVLMTVGISSPVRDGYADRIICLYDRQILSFSGAFGEGDKMSDCVGLSEFTLLCRDDGRIIDRIVNSADYRIGTEPIGEGILSTILTSPGTYREVNSLISTGGSGSYIIRIGTEEHVLSIRTFSEGFSGLCTVSLFRIGTVYGEGYELLGTIWGTLLVFAIIVAALSALFIIRLLDQKRKMADAALDNEILNCPTLVRFTRDADTLLKSHRAAPFALVLVRISNFDFIFDRYGEELTNGMLIYIRGCLRGSLKTAETYGYDAGGEFYLFLHAPDRRLLVDRLRSIYSDAEKFSGFPDESYSVNLSFNIYFIPRDERHGFQSLLDKVTMVRDSYLTKTGAVTFNFYDDLMRQNVIRRAEIEGRMESALKNSEFHLFYQPKYNLHADTIDGSEILVRWFDPKLGNYRTPGEFIPVFEDTGFISKMDRFVFYRACENIAERLSRRETVFPISVNVSRVTASEPDFVEYYTRIKSKFNIKDDFVTIEFTESFAYENNDYLARMVRELHEAGFLCSIDDFGTGYSSYTSLKMLNMDEIKLDKSFLESGVSHERDMTILRSVISLGRALGIKVTQEGVETKEEFDGLRALGCDVIQGYYFARPMKYSSYTEFVNNNFSPEAKRRQSEDME